MRARAAEDNNVDPMGYTTIDCHPRWAGGKRKNAPWVIWLARSNPFYKAQHAREDRNSVQVGAGLGDDKLVAQATATGHGL